MSFVTNLSEESREIIADYFAAAKFPSKFGILPLPYTPFTSMGQ
jgi:hypothetical protein